MIVVTGASDGLGKAVAALYTEAGKTVVNVSRRENPEVAHNIVQDLREGVNIKAAAEAIEAIDEPLEALIHCAGAISGERMGEITEAEIKRMMATNVKAPLLLTSCLFKRIKHDQTDIVVVSSTTGTRGTSEMTYGAAKWAERGVALNIQHELKQTPCRVISFCPGGMKTDLFKKGLDNDPTQEGTWMEPADVAKCLKQLLDLPKSMEVSEIIINRKNVGAND